jgi:hypothetical protein
MFGTGIRHIVDDMRVRIGQAANELSLSQDTLQRWKKAAKTEVTGTLSNGYQRQDIARPQRLMLHTLL